MQNPCSAYSPPVRPVPAGDWRLGDEGLHCLLPRRAVRVRAPAEALQAVQAICDGRRTWAEAEDELTRRWGDPARRFLQDLAQKGLLVDAGSQLSLLAQLGWTPQPFRPELTEAESLVALRAARQSHLRGAGQGQQLHHVADTPFTRLLSARCSSNTFADRPLPLQSLVNVLWALYGVVSPLDEGFRRTVPSGGGLHALRWHMALLRKTGVYEAGLYEIGYRAPPDEGATLGGVELVRREGQAHAAWRTLLQPAVLSFAHAIVYPCADIECVEKKYGNRALTLVLIELGHALQNAALAALHEDADTIVRGDTIETEVQSLLGTSADYPLPALVVGSRPSARERQLASEANGQFQLRMVPNTSRRLGLDTQLCVAGPIVPETPGEAPFWTAGRAVDARLAAIKAEAEAWERLGWSTPRGVFLAQRREVRDAVDPSLLVAYAEEQHRRDDFPFEPFDELQPYAWVPGVELHSGRPVSLLAQAVYALSSLSAEQRDRPYTNASTSGVAAWTSREGAIDRALIELVERDAFARAWLARQSAPLLPEEVLSDATKDRIEALRNAGYEVQVRLPESPWLPVASVGTRLAAGAQLTLTTGAGFSINEAVESALRETESRVQQYHGEPPLPAMEAGEVRLAHDHGSYYRVRENLCHAAFYFEGRDALAMRSLAPHAQRWAADGEDLLRRLRENAMPVFACDLTPPGACILQGRVPLHVWRVFVPGLLPLWFGYGAEPLGLVHSGVVRCDVAVDVPMRPGRVPVPVHPCT